jgi:hypothetical protein
MILMLVMVHNHLITINDFVLLILKNIYQFSNLKYRILIVDEHSYDDEVFLPNFEKNWKEFIFFFNEKMLFTQVIHDKYSDKKDVQSSFEYDLLFDQIKLTEKINEW